MTSQFDLQVPFFYPVWRRMVVIAICLVWAALEFAMGSPFWGALFGALGGISGWQFFVKNWPAPEEDSSLSADGD